MVKQWWSRRKCAAPTKMRPPAMTQWRSTSPLLRHLQQWRSQSFRSQSLHFWHHEPDKISPNFSPLFLLFSSLFFKENSRENINIFLYIFFSIIFFISSKLKKIIFHMIFFPFLNIFRKSNIALCYDGRKIGLPIYHGFKVISQ